MTRKEKQHEMQIIAKSYRLAEIITEKNKNDKFSIDELCVLATSKNKFYKRGK